MQNAEHFYAPAAYAIGNDVGGSCDDQFSRARYAARATEVRVLDKLVDALPDTSDHAFSRDRVIIGNMLTDLIDILERTT